jgi:hypothetical protein
MQGWDRLPYVLPISLIIFPIGGIYWGRWVWKATERSYADYLRDKASG